MNAYSQRSFSEPSGPAQRIASRVLGRRCAAASGAKEIYRECCRTTLETAASSRWDCVSTGRCGCPYAAFLAGPERAICRAGCHGAGAYPLPGPAGLGVLLFAGRASVDLLDRRSAICQAHSVGCSMLAAGDCRISDLWCCCPCQGGLWLVHLVCRQ